MPISTREQRFAYSSAHSPNCLEVETGEPLRLSTVTGSFDAYGHALTLETLGYSFDVTVYFAAHEAFTRNVLGRRGWLDQVRLGLVEYEGKLFLSRYE